MQEAKLSLIGQNRMQDLNGGPFGSFRNKIIGGDFGTNPWQRGTIFNGLTTPAYTADRWQYSLSGTSAIVNIVKDTGVPTVAQAGRLVTNSLLLFVNVPDAAVAATDFAGLVHQVEGYNFQSLAQRPMILSFWHNHSKTGIYSIALRNFGIDRCFTAEYVQTLTNTWEYTSIVIPPSPAAGTWNYTNGSGLTVVFTLMCGANFQLAPGSWQAFSNALGSPNQVNALDANSNIFRLALIQLESGTVATPFESRSFGEELELCQRYYEKSYDIAVAPGTLNGFAPQLEVFSNNAVNTITSGTISFKTKKRAVPTATAYLFGTANTINLWTYRSAGGVDSNRSTTAINPGQTGFQLQCATTAVTEISGFGHWTADAEL